MKKLQNNFTTPEQSKRLLEMGVPADSADLYYSFYTNLYERTAMFDTPSIINEDQHIEWSHKLTNGDTAYIPCWSVGKLIEIFSKCYTGAKCYYSPRNLHKTEFWMERFERLSKIGFMDFSKLEEE